ncbi:hypothetical protein [Vibrio antiquarius]|uniref:hypothetical protein n=1 Tax=Vibrio antiquarius (strain Ex25) TaxID=150340 RepID=UPI002659A5FD|nr:hypothetical protein [Vibrio antiquarius]MCR9847728.1 hypothetical protein [Vibrio antiquarius]MCR9913144.1 hypothetical protein [Vibrio antiquarius]
MSNTYGLEFEIAYLIMIADDDEELTAVNAVKLAKFLATNLSKKRLKNELLGEMKEVIRAYIDNGAEDGGEGGVELNYLI